MLIIWKTESKKFPTLLIDNGTDGLLGSWAYQSAQQAKHYNI